MAATIHDWGQAREVSVLFQAWEPAVAILAFPPGTSKSEALKWCPHPRPGKYDKKTQLLRHADVGGVTTSAWRIIHFSWIKEAATFPTIMKMKAYQRPLQTALDDTLGGEQVASFEPRVEVSGGQMPGEVVLPSGRCSPVFVATGLGPDISVLRGEARRFWVSANSAMNPEGPVLRQVRWYELFAMWDYEAKLALTEWSAAERA